MPRPRPIQTSGITRKMITGCGSLYVTINFDDDGQPFEVFSTMGKSGGCAASQSESISRLISLALRSGIKVEAVLKQLKGIRCPSPSIQSDGITLSCPDAIGKALEYALHEGKTKTDSFQLVKAKDLNGMCPECPQCGNLVEYCEGCILCRTCGYSKCG